MVLSVSVVANLKDTFKKSSPGVYSLVGLASKENEAVVLDAVKSDNLNSSNLRDPETCLTSLISHVVAGIHLIGICFFMFS